MHMPMSITRNSGGPISDLSSSRFRSGLMKPVRQRSSVYRNRESDKLIVAEKLANKVNNNMAELVERRGLTTRNGDLCRA